MNQRLNRITFADFFGAFWEKAWWGFSIVIVVRFIPLACNNPNLLVRFLSLLFIFAGILTLIYMEKMRWQHCKSRSWASVGRSGVVCSSLFKHKSRGLKYPSIRKGFFGLNLILSDPSI
ncbi:MAG: hypothetical protein SV375_12765 [Thermodesulfobacteriota bacterium]|nr:hypothetical protein [Thermodesulfobacteriota bacterium]